MGKANCQPSGYVEFVLFHCGRIHKATHLPLSLETRSRVRHVRNRPHFGTTDYSQLLIRLMTQLKCAEKPYVFSE